MKTLYCIIGSLFVLIHIGCQSPEDHRVFDSKKLEGKYVVDLSPFIQNETDTRDEREGVGKLANAMATLALSSIKIEMDFYDENKGVMQIEGGLLNFTNTLSDTTTVQKVHNFSYVVKNDSVLYMKFNKDTEYKKWGIIKKFSDSYDHLRFLVVKQGQDPVYFNLNKTE